MKNYIFRTPRYVFHGTTSNHLDSFNNEINLNRGAKYTDFGQGFYTTLNFKQAANWAKKRRDSYNFYKVDPKEYTEAIVIIYEINKNIFNKLNGNLFYYQNDNWINFLVENRSKKNSFKHNYDYVFGSVADGNINMLIDKLDNGIIKLENMKSLVIHDIDLFNSNQLTFHTEKSIRCLNRKEVRYVYERESKVKGL